MRVCGLPILLFLSCLMLPSSAQGFYISVGNPSFEADGLSDPGASISSISGWQIYPGSYAGVWYPTYYAYNYWAYYDQGDNVAWVNGGDFYQYITTVAANTTYTLDVLIGNRADYGIPLNGYRVDFLAYDYGTGTSTVITPTSFMRPVPAPGWWAWARTTWTVPSGSPLIDQALGIRLWSYLGWGDSAGQTNFDLVTLQATATGSETPAPVNSQPMDPSNPYDPNYDPIYDPTHDDYAEPSFFDPIHPSYDPSVLPPWAVPDESLYGDYNDDGAVDAADYTVWRDNLGGVTLANRDPANTGAIGEGDYASWKTHFGETIGGAGATTSPASSAAVPEPASALLLCLGLVGAVLAFPRSARPAPSRRG